MTAPSFNWHVMPGPASEGPALSSLGRALGWCALAASAAGAVAWGATDLLSLPRPIFLVPYVLAGTTVAWAFVRHAAPELPAAARAHPFRAAWVAAVASGLTIATVMVQAGAPRASGWRLAFELVWDGAIYGAVDGLLLTVVPMAAIQRASLGGRWSTDLFALFASLAVFIVYHLGFPEFRGAALIGPVVAGLVFGATYLAARNPLAPIVAHAVMHLAAVLHGPAGTAQLPPHY